MDIRQASSSRPVWLIRLAFSRSAAKAPGQASKSHPGRPRRASHARGLFARVGPFPPRRRRAHPRFKARNGAFQWEQPRRWRLLRHAVPPPILTSLPRISLHRSSVPRAADRPVSQSRDKTSSGPLGETVIPSAELGAGGSVLRLSYRATACANSSGLGSRGYSFIDPSWSVTAVSIFSSFDSDVRRA